ncbi:transposable element Tcb1 transposase [Elysia marginata]|uniref:Transposable element Tcb1 transposase n=1 Tax=Elysia marginata TaxID=1093978 RepID=A0AAV4EFZ8_9GAST|nr:transposable element Tcb1 transposase [Elysia marginata]
MRKHTCKDVPQAHVVPYLAIHRNIVFKQGNARAHTARYTQQFFKQSNFQVLPWPALSPDLNPIEHFWDYLQRWLDSQDLRPQNADDLEHSLRRHWNAILRHFLQTPVPSMGRRCAAVVEAQGERGGGTHYYRSLS